MFDKRVLSAGILCMTLGLTGCPDASRTAQADRRAVGPSPAEAGFGRAGGPAGRWAGVKLTLTERAGADRIDERVTTGVPLPQGLIKDASELSLLGPDGRPIPAEIRPVLRWPDQSIKWVHLYFQADCKAKGQTSVTLTRGQAAKWTSKLKVADGDDAVTVTTGPLKFVVRKKGFNLIDAAWIDPTGEGRFDDAHRVIKPHGRGLVVRVGGKEFLGVHDKEVQVAVEEQGPMHVVIRAEGAHRNAAGEKMLDFVVRLYAYHDSPEVKVVHTFLNRQGQRADHVDVQAMHIELPTAVRLAIAFLADEEGFREVRLPDGEKPWVHAANGPPRQGGRPGEARKTYPGNVGWVWAESGGPSIGVGVRWFAEMYPKSLELNGGFVRVGLYPGGQARPLKVYTGVARTHDLKLLFMGRPRLDRIPRTFSAFAALRRPLRAFAPPRWYCRDTKAFGLLAEADKSLYDEKHRPAVKRYDDNFEASYQKCRRAIDGRTRNGVTRHSYGLLEWGDGFHWALGEGVEHPQNLMWDGNYYGFPHMMAMQWARTGKAGYFELFETHARHVADVHLVHHDHETWRIGANRYCPPPEHVRMHESDDYTRNPVYVSNTFNHHKSQGLFESWYLLADHRMLDALNELAAYVMRYKSADYDRSQPRGPGFLMMTLAEFCDFYERDAKWLARIRQAFAANRDKTPRLHYQAGFLLEGARKYYEVTGDPEALAYIRKWCEKIMKGRTRTSCNRAHAYGFLYGRTGQAKYRDFGAASVQRCSAGYGNCWKDFASDMRSGMFMLYHLTTGAAADAGKDAK